MQNYKEELKDGNVCKKIVLDYLDYLAFKVRNDSLTMEETNSLAKTFREGRPNEGFTFANQGMKEALVVIGPTTSGAEFQNTLVHEVHHLAVAIANSLGIDLESETPAYIAGDSTRELSDIICWLGCDNCNREAI